MTREGSSTFSMRLLAPGFTVAVLSPALFGSLPASRGWGFTCVRCAGGRQSRAAKPCRVLPASTRSAARLVSAEIKADGFRCRSACRIPSLRATLHLSISTCLSTKSCLAHLPDGAAGAGCGHRAPRMLSGCCSSPRELPWELCQPSCLQLRSRLTPKLPLFSFLCTTISLCEAFAVGSKPFGLRLPTRRAR